MLLCAGPTPEGPKAISYQQLKWEQHPDKLLQRILITRSSPISRKNLNEFLTQSLDSPEFRRAFVQVSEETATRPVRACRCVVVAIPETAKTDDFAHLTPGTVTAFVAEEGEPLLRKLTETIEANNSEEFSSAIDQIKQMEAKVFSKITASLIYPESKPRALPSFAEISYANKTLISHIHVDEVLRVHVHPFVYNGGYLDRNRFSMVEYYQAGRDTPLTCLLIVRQPKLSEIEREALRLVPSDSSANNIAPSLIAPVTPVLLQVLLAATPVAAQFVYNEIVNFIVFLLHGTAALASIPDAVLEGEDFQNMVKSLPPEVTAAELLRLRTDILLQKPPK